MEFKDLLLKMAKNEQLTPIELETLANYGTDTQQKNSFLAGIITSANTLNLNFPIDVIYSEVLEKDVESVAVDIPQSFTHLFIISYGKHDNATYPNLRLIASVNDDTGNNYNLQLISANSTTLAGQQILNNIQFGVGYLAYSGLSNRAGTGFCIIPHYKSGFYKHAITLSSATNTTDDTIIASDGIWKDTDAIQKLTFKPSIGSTNIVTGSVITVIGIR